MNTDRIAGKKRKEHETFLVESKRAQAELKPQRAKDNKTGANRVSAPPRVNELKKVPALQGRQMNLF